MSFRFSVGDFLAAAGLIEQAVSALQEAGGSSFQYQRLSLQLHALGKALQEVDRLEYVEGLEPTVEAIKATALSCQLPLQEFLNSVKKYDQSLGLGQSAGIMKDVVFKVKFVSTKKPEAVTKLRAEITAYLGSINLLLGLYQVKLNALAEEKARQRFETLSTTLATLQLQNRTITCNVARVSGRVEEGTQIVREEIELSSTKTYIALQELGTRSTAAIIGILGKVGRLSDLTIMTYAKVNEMYKILLFLRSNLSGPDICHTWFQEPMRFEDAYGRIWPIPVEYDFPMMEGVLRGKFQKGPGKKLVERDLWQLFESSNAQNILSANNWEPVPRMKITMAMIIPQTDSSLSCPRLNCLSNSFKDAPGGGKICAVCGTWFDDVPDPIESGFTEFTALYTAAGDIEDEFLGGFKPSESNFQDESDREVEIEVDDDDLRHLKNARLRRLAVQAPNTQLLHLRRPGKGPLPVLATFDPHTEGNWIASRIVKRLQFKYQQASIHKDVPTFMGQSFRRTRLFVDFTCGKQRRKHRCQHRFYVVNHCNTFDILLGRSFAHNKVRTR